MPENSKARKKVVFLITTLTGGGAERVVVRLANALSEKHDVIVMPLYKAAGDSVSDRVRIEDFQFPGIDNMKAPLIIKSAYWRFYAYRAFCRMLKKEKPDVTVSFLYKPHLLNMVAIGAGKKIMSERAVPKVEGAGSFAWTKLAFSFADTVVFQSHTVKGLFPKRIRKKGVVIPNPVDVPCYASGRSHRIVTAGRLMGQKNHAMLIRAFASFSKSHPLHTLHIYGTGDLEEKLRDLIREYSLEGKVFLEGFSANVHEAIKDAEQFVLSSDFEGMPNALLEALMMGLPCITTSFLGAEEFFGESNALIMTPVGDENAMSEAMTKLADDDDFRVRIASTGAEFAKRFSFDSVIPQWETVLFDS